jgi:hypothetical protein
MDNFRKYFTLILVSIFFSNFTYAQEGTGESDPLVEDTKNDLMIVMACGVGGAVLGLSTLSFVDEPKKHTKNIVMGAAIGIIIGVGVVGFSQANKSKELFYQDGQPKAYSSPEFDTAQRSDWHHENLIDFSSDEIPVVGYSTNF